MSEHHPTHNMFEFVDGASFVVHPLKVLAPQRHAIIVGEVNRRGSVRVRELAALLDVSEMTVRRDLDQLASAGQIRKVHGGASRLEARSAEEPGFAIKRELQRDEKNAIARTAASLVEPGSAIGITGGTTTWLLSQYLRTVDNLTIVTNSLSLAAGLHGSDNPSLNVVLTGGSRTKSDALVGPIAVSTLRSLYVDIVFMGVHGMAGEPGFTTPNLAEAETNRAFIQSSERFMVLADHTKWDTRGLGTIARLSDADVVISDDRLTEGARQTIADECGELLIADHDGGTDQVEHEPSGDATEIAHLRDAAG